MEVTCINGPLKGRKFDSSHISSTGYVTFALRSEAGGAAHQYIQYHQPKGCDPDKILYNGNEDLD